jgi:hypothetical protein
MASLWQTPHASMRMRIWSGPGSTTGSSGDGHRDFGPFKGECGGAATSMLGVALADTVGEVRDHRGL